MMTNKSCWCGVGGRRWRARAAQCVGMACAISAGVYAQPAGPKKPTLLYVESDPKDGEGTGLAESDRLTVEKYQADGVQVIPVSRLEFENWLRNDGSNYLNGTLGFQAMAFAGHKKADGIGGLMIWEVSERDASVFRVKAGKQMSSWGLSPSACTANTIVDLRPLETKEPVPLYLSGVRERPWELSVQMQQSDCPKLEDSPAFVADRIGSGPLPEIPDKDIDGKEIRLSDLKGKVVLIEFWATWCVGCIEEMPLHQMLWERYKDRGFEWISVNADEDSKGWEAFIKSNHVGGRQVRSLAWTSRLNVKSFPTHVILDREGTIYCKTRSGGIAPLVAKIMEGAGK